MAKKKTPKIENLEEEKITPLQRYKNLVQGEQNIRQQLEQLQIRLHMTRGAISVLKEEHEFTDEVITAYENL